MKRLVIFMMPFTGLLCFALGRATTQKASSLSQKTLDNVGRAMHREAFTYAEYLLFAESARKTGNRELANLFERTARTERFLHFKEESELAGLVGDNRENLLAAIDGESYEVDSMYRQFADQAAAAGDKQAAHLFEVIRHDEMAHLARMKAAFAKLELRPASQ